MATEKELVMNIHGKTRAILLLLVVLVSARAVWGLCQTCGWRDRGDRFEGIATEQIAGGGGCCEIVGIHYKRAGKIDASASRLNLFFWLPAEATPDIRVWQPSTNYMMVPKLKKYPGGLRSFSWPRQDVIGQLGVNLDTLFTRVHDDSRKVYFPVLLSTSSNPEPAGSYLFILESGVGINARCTVEREAGGKLTPIRNFPWQEEFGGILQIPWDGLDDKGKPAAPGTYVFQLSGQQEGERIETLNFKVRFQHYDKFQ
ncbi:MAG TPA: hypothetical protein VKK31_01020 [Thermoanaerobaculia bacterium]|nr:hypothetical protein [Thermoanaerobaculia bacterium]